MNRLKIPKRAEGADYFKTPGPWWWPLMDDGVRNATIKCPQCGTAAALDHDIDAQGNVSPSVVCPKDGCTWHVFVQLEGW